MIQPSGIWQKNYLACLVKHVDLQVLLQTQNDVLRHQIELMTQIRNIQDPGPLLTNQVSSFLHTIGSIRDYS
jgi:hypothetical protein